MLSQPDEQVDVLVIGSGPAGLSAAIAAGEAGASVLVLEREDVAGGAGWYGSGFFAAGTDWQVAEGITDSPAAALTEWADFTGGDGGDAQIVQFVEGSVEVVDWLAALGAEVVLNAQDSGAGTVRRIHSITNDGPGPISLLIGLVEEDIWLSTEATALLTDASGAVIGASFARTDGSGEGWIEAEAVVVASGGFARDVARVIADRPGLSEIDFVAEAAHSTDGGGHGLLESIGVPLGGPGSQGVYVQSIADPREPGSLEALWLPDISRAVIVDSAGQRQVNESLVGDLTRIDWLLSDPEKRLWAVLREGRLRAGVAMIPAYNWATLGSPETLNGGELIETLSLTAYDTPADLGAGEGIDPDGLATTITDYDLAAEAGADPLGKDASAMEILGGHPLLALPLAPGASKSFGGVLTTASGAVLGADGAVIPGLFAAGEVAGMLGTSSIGRGFSGSVTACYLGGLTAGESAAAKSR